MLGRSDHREFSPINSLVKASIGSTIIRSDHIGRVHYNSPLACFNSFGG